MKTIPPEILQQAEAQYAEYDKCGFPKTQKEIALKLLQLRVFFRQNQKVDDIYRMDINLIENNEQPNMVSMLLTTESQLEGQMKGINQLKSIWIEKNQNQDQITGKRMKVHKIDVDEWKKMSEKEKVT